jgi:hypothetical protein
MEDSMSRILQLLSLLVLLLFAGIWVWVGIRVLQFHPATPGQKVSFTDAQVTVAGFLASAVGAGTASVLGIEVQKVAAEQGQSIALQIGQATKASVMLSIGILTYALVGIFVLLVWLAKSDITSDMVSAFALGVLGWLGGSFAAVFQKTD